MGLEDRQYYRDQKDWGRQWQPGGQGGAGSQITSSIVTTLIVIGVLEACLAIVCLFGSIATLPLPALSPHILLFGVGCVKVGPPPFWHYHNVPPTHRCCLLALGHALPLLTLLVPSPPHCGLLCRPHRAHTSFSLALAGSSYSHQRTALLPH